MLVWRMIGYRWNSLSNFEKLAKITQIGVTMPHHHGTQSVFSPKLLENLSDTENLV